jgi:hypothetical protein
MWIPVKHFLSVLLRALERARHFALVEGSAIPTKGSLVIVSGLTLPECVLETVGDCSAVRLVWLYKGISVGYARDSRLCGRKDDPYPRVTRDGVLECLERRGQRSDTFHRREPSAMVRKTSVTDLTALCGVPPNKHQHLHLTLLSQSPKLEVASHVRWLY